MPAIQEFPDAESPNAISEFPDDSPIEEFPDDPLRPTGEIADQSARFAQLPLLPPAYLPRAAGSLDPNLPLAMRLRADYSLTGEGMASGPAMNVPPSEAERRPEMFTGILPRPGGTGIPFHPLGTPGKVAAGIVEGAEDLVEGVANFLISPGGIVQTGAMYTPLSPVVALKFAKEMVEGGLISTGEAYDAYKRGDPREFAKQVTLGLGLLAGATGIVKHGVTKAGDWASAKTRQRVTITPESAADLQAALANPFKPAGQVSGLKSEVSSQASSPASADLSADPGRETPDSRLQTSGALAEIERQKAETQQRQDRIAASQPYTTEEASQDLPDVMESLKAQLGKQSEVSGLKSGVEPGAPASADLSADVGRETPDSRLQTAPRTADVRPPPLQSAAARAARLDALETADELGMLTPEQKTELDQLRRDNGSEGTAPAANAPLTPPPPDGTTGAGAAAETITGQNEQPGSEATGRASGPEPMPAEVPAAQAVNTPKPRPTSRLSPLTEDDGLLHQITGGYGKIPIFIPDPLTLSNWQRLKARGAAGRSPAEEAYWRRLEKRFPPNFEDDYGVNGEDAISAYRAARRAGIDVETFAPNDGGAQGLDRLLDFVRRETRREITARDLWAEISGVAQRHETARVSGKQAEQFNAKVLRGERPKTQRGQVERFASGELREGDSFTVQGQGFEVREHELQDGTPIVKLRDGPKFGEQTVYGNEPLHVDKGSFEAGPEHGDARPKAKSRSEMLSEDSPLFGKPETVEQQRARLVLEQKRKSEISQLEELHRRAGKPLVGKVGDLGQGDLLGGGDLFALRDDPAYVESRKPELDEIARDLYGRPYDELPEADQGKIQVTLEHEDAQRIEREKREEAEFQKRERERQIEADQVSGHQSERAPDRRPQTSPAGETPGEPVRPVRSAAPAPEAARKPEQLKDRRAALENLSWEIYHKSFGDLFDDGQAKAHLRDELRKGRRAGESPSDPIEKQIQDLWDEQARLNEKLNYQARGPNRKWSAEGAGILAQIERIGGRLDQLREIASGTPEQKAQWIRKFLQGDKPADQVKTLRLIKGSAAEKWADAKIDEARGQGRLFTGLDPELLAAYAVKGAAIIEGGVRDFAAWSAEMLKEFGEAIRPHLHDLFAQSRKRLEDFRARAAEAKGNSSVQEDRAAVSKAEEELRVANRLANQPAERTAAGVTKEEARARRTTATAALHAAQEKLWHNPEFVEETMQRQLEIARERKVATDPDRKAELDQEFESLAGDLEQSPKRLVSAIAKKLMKWGAIKRQGETEAGSQHPGTEGEGRRSEVGDQILGAEIAPEHTQAAKRARAAQTLRELPARTREFFHAAAGVRERIANTWSARHERDAIASTYDAAENGGSVFGRQASNEVLHALNRSFGATGEAVQARNPIRESALTFVIESGRDPAALDEAKVQLKGSTFGNSRMGKQALAAVDFAETHWDRLEPVADLYAKITDAQVEHENVAGVDTLYRKGGYVLHLQDLTAHASQLDLGGSGGGFGPGSPFRKIRDHATYADAISSGVVPKSLNAVDLLQKRISMGQKLINHGAWVDGMRRIQDPKTLLPIVSEMQTHVRQDGKTYQAAPPGYEQVNYAGQNFAVLKPYDNLLKLLVTPSTVRTSRVGHVAMELAGGIKHSMLVFDSYHLGRLAFWNAMVRGRVLPGNPFAHRRGLTLLDQTLPEIQRMIEAKEIPAAFGKDLVESKRQLSLLISKGLNVGGVADNIATHFVQNLPIAGRFNRFLFQQFQRGATAEASLIELRRIQKMQPNVPEAVLARRVAADLNKRFGNLQSQSWIKNKNLSDLMRIFFLAPQWNESLIRSELGAVKDLGLAIPDSVRNRRLAVGTLGRVVFTAALGTFLGNQIINYITRGTPTWENPEEGHEAKLSAWIPDVVGNGPGYFNNPLTLPAEMSELALKKTERSGDFTQAAKQILASRLGPVGRVPYTLLVREDELGAKLKGPGAVVGQMASGLMPLPISGGTLARAGKQLVTGRPEEKYPGQFEHQVFQTFGVKLDAAPDAGRRIARLATEFNREKGITPSAEFFHGDYYDLDSALRVGNTVRIQAALDEVLQKRTPDAVRKHYKTWATARFTGQKERETEFKETLSAEQTQTYERAMVERERLRDQVDGLLP